jgi:heme exporter protein D
MHCLALSEGWIAIGVTLLSMALAIGFRLFIRKQINKELAAQKQAPRPPADSSAGE